MIKLTCQFCKKQFDAHRKDMRSCLEPKCRKALHAWQQRERNQKARKSTNGEPARSSSSASSIPDANDLIARLNALLETLSAWADERAAIGELIQACHDKIEKGRYDAQSLKMRLRAIYIRVAAQTRASENDRLSTEDSLAIDLAEASVAKPEKS